MRALSATETHSYFISSQKLADPQLIQTIRLDMRLKKKKSEDNKRLLYFFFPGSVKGPRNPGSEKNTQWTQEVLKVGGRPPWLLTGADLNQGLKSRCSQAPGREETGRDRAGRGGGEARSPRVQNSSSESSAGPRGWAPAGRPGLRAAGLRRLDLNITARFKDHR